MTPKTIDQYTKSQFRLQKALWIVITIVLLILVQAAVVVTHKNPGYSVIQSTPLMVQILQVIAILMTVVCFGAGRMLLGTKKCRSILSEEINLSKLAINPQTKVLDQKVFDSVATCRFKSAAKVSSGKTAYPLSSSVLSSE